jgi:hypothetical protein
MAFDACALDAFHELLAIFHLHLRRLLHAAGLCASYRFLHQVLAQMRAFLLAHRNHHLQRLLQ